VKPITILALAALALPTAASGQAAPAKPRARDLGVPFDGTPGPLNAITDVAGVTVGQMTIVSGKGPLVVGQGPARTGVTAVLPRGATNGDPVMAGWFTLNGNGEMTGTTWLEESGFLAGPVMITNTHSVGVVRDAVIEWLVHKGFDFDWSLPVVAETWDGSLNDINGFHVTKQDAFRALDSARSGPVAEGNVGGGTGMICHQFKGGIGTASRRFTIEGKTYTLGVLVQCNYGVRRLLRIAGVPVGAEIPDLLPCLDTAEPRPKPMSATRGVPREWGLGIRAPAASGRWARSSSSWQPTYRCSRTSCSAWHATSPSASARWAAWGRTARATSMSRFRPPTRVPRKRRACTPRRSSRTRKSRRYSRPRCRRPKNRSPTPSSPRRR